MPVPVTVANVSPMDTFIARWEKAGGKERANYQMFFAELCDALGVERPNPQGGPVAYGLVKLNAQRAEEERNGLIRWLRPEYQNPSQATAQAQPRQAKLADIPETEPSAPVSASQQKWPKDFKDQLTAIRDLLRTQGGEWTIDAIAHQFKNASRSKAKIQMAIASLETLGLVTQHTENDKITWYFAEHPKTA